MYTQLIEYRTFVIQIITWNTIVKLKEDVNERANIMMPTATMQNHKQSLDPLFPGVIKSIYSKLKQHLSVSR